MEDLEAPLDASAAAALRLPGGGPRGRGERRTGARLRPVLRALLRVVCFPWLIWSAVALAPRGLRRSRLGEAAAGRALAHVLHGALYLGVGLPATLFVTGEVLITANEWLIGEQADYRLQSDFAAGLVDAPLEIPGPATPPPSAAAPGAGEPWRRHLVERFAPVIVQKVAHHPEWDVPLALQFDGNDDPRDNVVNEPRHRPHRAAVHAELTAETEDSYYLTYSLYHVKDYDHPLRQLLTDWTYHDNDNEGFMIRVDKESLEVVELEAWFHNRFLFYNRTGRSTGTEPVHGAIRLEDGTHPVIYAQSQGHGVRAFQASDRDALSGSAKLLRWRGERPAVPVRVDRSVQTDATYDLVSFDAWYSQATGPLGSKGRGEGIFEEAIPLGRWEDGTPIVIGRFIAGWDYSKVGWSRPKPPWSWDDGWDRVPIFVWHFLPSHAFASHGGSELSHRYLYNRPLEKTFGDRASDVVRHLRLGLARRPGAKWEGLESRGGKLEREVYWRGFQILVKRYVNYLFHALG